MHTAQFLPVSVSLSVSLSLDTLLLCSICSMSRPTTEKQHFGWTVLLQLPAQLEHNTCYSDKNFYFLPMNPKPSLQFYR